MRQLRGFGDGRLGRAVRRNDGFGPAELYSGKTLAVRPRRIGKPGDRGGVPFVENLTDAAELHRLSGEQALMHTVSDVIIDWSEQQTSRWWTRQFGNHEADAEAEALAQLIQLCRTNTCGSHAGTSQPERAFQILKLRMARTEAAKAAKYWWTPESLSRRYRR